LELGLLANAIIALIAAAGIYLDKRWGWLLGIAVCSISVLLWFVQETVGLPGLPKQWLEPSRVLSLLIELAFVIVAWKARLLRAE